MINKINNTSSIKHILETNRIRTHRIKSARQLEKELREKTLNELRGVKKFYYEHFMYIPTWKDVYSNAVLILTFATIYGFIWLRMD